MRSILKICMVVGILLLGVILFMVRLDIPVDELEPKYANENSKYVPVNGTNVHYRDEGTGPVLVLLHGNPASLHTWDGWAAELKDQFRIIRPDLPGFGLTGPSAQGDYRMPAYVRFLHNFLSELGIEETYLAGNSFGGQLAWEYAAAHPDRVKKLVLIDSSGYPRKDTPLVFRMSTIPAFQPLFRYVTPRFMIENSVKEAYSDDDKITPELIDRYQEMLLREGNREAFLKRMIVRKASLGENIKGIESPTLILWGKDDEWVPEEDAHRFHKDIEDSELIIYDDVGHMPMEEIPERSAEDARRFLQQ